MSYKKNTQVEVLPVVDLCKNSWNGIFSVGGATQVSYVSYSYLSHFFYDVPRTGYQVHQHNTSQLGDREFRQTAACHVPWYLYVHVILRSRCYGCIYWCCMYDLIKDTRYTAVGWLSTPMGNTTRSRNILTVFTIILNANCLYISGPSCILNY